MKYNKLHVIRKIDVFFVVYLFKEPQKRIWIDLKSQNNKL